MTEATWTERAVDTVLDVFRPKRAQLRRLWRKIDRDPNFAQTYFAAMNARGYVAAESGNGRADWKGVGNTSADAELLPGADTMRARSQAAGRNDPIASGLYLTFRTNVIGQGLRPQAQTGDDAKNKACEEVWREREDELDPVNDLPHCEHQGLAFGKVLEDGGVVVVASKAEPGEPVWMETVELDRLSTPTDLTTVDLLHPMNTVIKGVEKDRWSRPVQYWINRHHPGDNALQDSFSTHLVQSAFRGKAYYDAVPKARARHVKLTRRPGQTHGEIHHRAVLQEMRDLDLLLLASLKRAQIGSCLAAFIKSEADVDDLMHATAAKYGYKLDQDIEPGMLFKLFPGESIEPFVPNLAIAEFEPFIITLARRIGAALGISWQSVLRDWSKSNYSSARTQLLDDRRTYTWMQGLLIKQLLCWEWQTVLEDALLRGDERLAAAGVTVADVHRAKVKWLPNGWDWVDPAKEGQAIEIKMGLGLTTLRDEAAMLGRDWEDLQDQQIREQLRREKREAELRKEMGLPAKPKAPPGQKGDPSANDEDDEEDPESEDEDERTGSMPRRRAA